MTRQVILELPEIILLLMEIAHADYVDTIPDETTHLIQGSVAIMATINREDGELSQPVRYAARRVVVKIMREVRRITRSQFYVTSQCRIVDNNGSIILIIP